MLITETGLRASDACTLPFDPLLTDSAGWPCLRFASSKMRAEHLLPLSARAVEAIRAQQRHLRQSHPDGSAWLFPSRSDPHLPVPYEAFCGPSPSGSTASACTTRPAAPQTSPCTGSGTPSAPG